MSNHVTMNSGSSLPSLRCWRSETVISKLWFLCSSVQQFRSASVTSTAPRLFMDNVADTSNEMNKSRIVTRRFSKISASARAAFTSVLLVLNRLVRLWTFVRPFSKSPQQILTCCIHHKISTHLHQLAANFVRGNVSYKSQYELLRENKLPLPQHTTLPHE